MSDSLNETEERCHMAIRKAQERYQAEIAPYIETLSKIYSMRPKPPIIISKAVWDEINDNGVME